MGASVFGVAFDIFLDNLVDAVTVVSFLIFYSFTLYRTFGKKSIRLRYPILATVFWIASTFIIFLVVSHL